MSAHPFFYRETQGIRVTVKTQYVPERSSPEVGQYVFAYFVRIENVGPTLAQLISRRWLIRDSIGEESEVAGEGVVGEQPALSAGEVYQYQSFCVLKSPCGSMEGQYFLVRSDGTRFAAEIPRFILDAGEGAELR